MPRLITLTPNPALDVSVETDAVAPNRKIRCDHPRIDPGGGGVNVSRAAHRLGAGTLAVFPIGGTLGEALADRIAAEGIEMLAVPTKSETRIAFAARDRNTGNEYRFGLPGGALSSAEQSALLEGAGNALAADDFLVGSGSLPPGASEDFWAQASRLAKGKKARFALDSTSGLVPAIAEGIDVLRLNKADAPALAGRDLGWRDDAAAFAQSLVKAGGAHRVIMSHGANGAILVTAGAIHHCPSFKVPIVSAVGAGDSFFASFLAALLRGEADAAALRWGMAAAAATLKTPGTALFDSVDVHSLYGLPPEAELKRS